MTIKILAQQQQPTNQPRQNNELHPIRQNM